ncbi:apolipoprotein N-acyltransferase [candidate division KSB1 bacterium]|nr:apolipoprotein N-acyltransferase [candidate division KSB1 bacterium]
MKSYFADVAGFYLSAVLGIFCFPPFGFWPLAYFALVPFLFAAVHVDGKRARRHGYAAGFVFFGGLLYWIGLNSGAPVWLAWTSAFAVVAILATVWSVSAWAVSRIHARHGAVWSVALFVALYVFLEVFWGTGELGFPWAIWALSQSRFLPAIQMVELGDVYGLSLWVLSVNALLFLVLTSRRHWLSVSLFLLVLLSVPLYGVVRLWSLDRGPRLDVAAVQVNTPVDDKWDGTSEAILDCYVAATRPLADSNIELVVWPETATPVPLRFRDWARRRLQHLSDSSGLAIVTGATDYAGEAQRGMAPYNAAFYVRPDEPELQASAKVHLVPFGERIPGQRLFPFLGKVRLGQAEFMPAREVEVFDRHGAIPPFACLICFEVLFPDVAADMVTHGALLLANITEDGWYGRSSEQSQHLELTRLRAVAVRRSIVRAANLGYPAIILPTGEIASRLNLDQAGIVQCSVPLESGITPAARCSRLWLPFYSCALLALVGALYLKARRA